MTHDDEVRSGMHECHSGCPPAVMIPPRGTMAREWAELYVRVRQLGRAITAEVRRTLGLEGVHR